MAFHNAAQLSQLVGLFDQLLGMLRGRFGQGFGYGAEGPGLLGKLGQLPGHGQQLCSQQPVAQGLGPFRLLVNDPVEVDNGVDSERGSHGGSAPFRNDYTQFARLFQPLWQLCCL